MTILIRKRRNADGTSFQIEDFKSYALALSERGIEAPKAKYQIHIPDDIERQMRDANIDIEDQIALFFRLSPASGFDYEIVES